MSGALPVPAPAVFPETAPFWEATARGKLLLSRCEDCGAVIWYPRPLCPACGRPRVSWVEASGRGSVYSFTVVHRNAVDGYREAVPYVVAYVELEEGPRVLTNIVGCDPEAVTIGMPVSATFDDTGHGSALFRFRPA